MDNEEKEVLFFLSRKNMEISIANASMFPGFRFSPTDEELICYYLKKKLEGSDKCVEVIPEVDICGYEPWDLPAKSIIRSDDEWFFFSPRGRKYPNGSQSKRATTCGYWKATGKERNVKSGSKVIGTKRTLVFHTGRAPRGQRTEWIMHEYCINQKAQDLMVVCRLRKNNEFSLDDNRRKRSHDSLAMDSNAAALSGVEQNGVREGTMIGAECCSKDCSSSYNSHSVEQNDSGFESDEKINNAISQHASSSHQQVEDSDRDEEDCYADIMKDDIIKLDESSLTASAPPSPVLPGESQTRIHSKEPSQVFPARAPAFQGIASRRLKLRRLRSGLRRAEPLTAYQLNNDDAVYKKELVSRKDSEKSLKSLISATAIKSRVLCFMILLFLLLFGEVVIFLRSNFTTHHDLKSP